MKKCNLCKMEKEFSEFGRSRQNKDGYRRECRKCRKKYYLKPKDQVEAWNKRRKERMSELGSRTKGKTLSEEIKLKMKASKMKLFEGHNYEPACIKRIYQRYTKKGLKLSQDNFKNLIYSCCHYCGIKPNSKQYSSNREKYIYYNGIDRIDNFEGYSINNIVPCCCICNKAKLDMSIEDFKKWIYRIYHNWVS